MASPNVTTPLPRRRRSVTGPFVLILLGILFLLGTSHIISLARLGYLFGHYWPAILIVWGVLKLIEHQQAQREGAPAPGIGVGGVFLIISIIFFGLIATQMSRFNWSEIRDHMDIDDSDFENMFGSSYNFDDHLEQDFPAGASLKVFDTRGAVSVHASDDNKITVVVRKRVGAENQGDADKYNGQTKPTITTIGGLVTLNANAEAAGDRPVESNLDISLPRKVAVTIYSRHGDVTITGRDGNIDVNSQRADTTVEDVNGNVKLTLDKGSAKVEQVTGDVHVEGRLNDTSVSDVKGMTQLDGEFQESVKLARITKTVGFKSSRTDMELSRLDGDLDLDSGDLHADQTGGPLRLITRSKDIRLDEISGDARVENSNGAIELSVRSLGNLQIQNRSGDIQISLPEKAGFRLDARTRDAEISSDFPEIKIDNGDHADTATGTVGNGAAHLVISNENGNIEIRKASGQPPKPPEPPKPAAKPAGKALPAPKAEVKTSEN
jgi:DUF4097 and DUF4098 domain-containing protein YvlB